MQSAIVPFLETQVDVLTQVRQRIRDTANRRWTQTEVYNAINDGLRKWQTRVLIPFVYTLTDGLDFATYTYALPWYVVPPLNVEFRRLIYLDGLQVQFSDVEYTYQEVPAWRLEPDGSGGQVLRLEISPFDADARVIWWAVNGPVPLTVPTLSANITTTTATTCTIAATPIIGNAGYVKIDSEWMQYSGYTQTSSTTTLQNLVRGVNGTTAATHTSATSVYWGIAAHRLDLFTQLYEEVLAGLHNLFLQDASPKETEHHTFQVRYHQQIADEYWKMYVPNRPAQMKLSRAGIGLL